MTNREAIKIINQYDMNFHWNDGEPIPAEQLAEAFDLSISALKKQEVNKCCEACKYKHLDVDACPCCDCIRAKDHYIPYTGEEA